MVKLAEEPPRITRKLVGVRDICKILNRSRSTVLRLDDAGEIPRSVRLGAGRLWVLSQVEKWVEDGCPRQTTPAEQVAAS